MFVEQMHFDCMGGWKGVAMDSLKYC
jgi:hypothetical protein